MMNDVGDTDLHYLLFTTRSPHKKKGQLTATPAFTWEIPPSTKTHTPLHEREQHRTATRTHNTNPRPKTTRAQLRMRTLNQKDVTTQLVLRAPKSCDAKTVVDRPPKFAS